MLSRFLALLLLFCLMPLFFIIVVGILLEDGFPFIFKQKRIGANNAEFEIWKFRSMRRDTPNVATHLLDNPDKYLLKIGKVIRKMSFDELPNLVNILRGEMVFVGPRPALYNQYDLIDLRVNSGLDKLQPGITGWAQVNGRDELSLEEKVKFEKEYVQRKSLYFDTYIIFLTFKYAVISKGVSH
ncbi:MAG: sugar transferase [Hydrotalea sp.]|nr:sugar transferase [Hydrotalea sp.]